jgi:hypothetical protein
MYAIAQHRFDGPGVRITRQRRAADHAPAS